MVLVLTLSGTSPMLPVRIVLASIPRPLGKGNVREYGCDCSHQKDPTSPYYADGTDEGISSKPVGSKTNQFDNQLNNFKPET